jgi:putative adhesin/cell wall-active antibiotic response 4TMS protein YvqF
MSNGKPRGSAFGAIFLVFIGTLFLVHNFRPDWIRWSLLGKWWPLLLIFWGVVRLIENLAGTGRRGVTGGEGFLLVVLILGGIAISVGSRFPGSIHIDDSEDLPFEESADVTQELPPRDLPPGTLVRIDTGQGDITVDGSGDEKQMHVVVRTTGHAMSDEEAHSRAAAAAKAVSFRQSSGDVRLEANPPGGRDSNTRVNFEVHLPRNVALDLRTARGDVHVNVVTGNVTATVSRGDVGIRDTGGDVRADLGRGDVRISGAKGNVHVSGNGSEVEIADVGGAVTIDGEFYGPITARNAAKGAHFVSSHTDLTIGALPGRMTVESGDLQVENAGGPLLLSTSDKSISLEEISGRLRVQNKRGDITVRLTSAPKEEIDLTNESGAIELALPEKSSFEMAASSRSGEIDNDLNDSALKTTQQAGDAKLEGKVGVKGPKITLNTSYGPIRLKRSD